MPRPKIEGHNMAWHRCYEYRGAGSGWLGEDKCPIRLRGYSELVMGRVPPKIRKAIDTALKRGYRLSGKKDFRHVMEIILENNPIQKFIPIGYVGKSRFNVKVNCDVAVEMVETLKGLSAIDDKFDGDTVHYQAGSPYSEVYVREWVRAGGKGSSNQPQLKAGFTHVRAIIDTYMEEEAAIREQIARWCSADDCTIRIPFDTHKEESNAS